MAGGDLLVDRLVAGGFLRPAVLLRGLQLRRPALSCWRVGLLMGLSGLLVEPPGLAAVVAVGSPLAEG